MAGKVEKLYLEDFEEMVVVAVFRLGPGFASAIAVEHLLETALNETMNLAKVYDTLKALCENGLLKSEEVGSRTFYKFTSKTLSVLRRTAQRRVNLEQ